MHSGETQQRQRNHSERVVSGCRWEENSHLHILTNHTVTRMRLSFHRPNDFCTFEYKNTLNYKENVHSQHRRKGICLRNALGLQNMEQSVTVTQCDFFMEIGACLCPVPREVQSARLEPQQSLGSPLKLHYSPMLDGAMI